VVAELLVLAGALLTCLAGIGVVRFDDVFARLHALSKATTLGFLLVLLGAAIALSDPNDITSLVLAAALQLLTSPVGTGLLGRAAYRAEGYRPRVDTVDQLADADLD
jgi:multicomponent Na+:H+ antiporter subunit G